MDLSELDRSSAQSRYAISPFWFWNDRITDEEVDRQLGLMKDIGALQPIIHARSGLETEYLSEDWFMRVSYAVAEAASLGMLIWLYDEYNWPSGNCNGTVTSDERLREHFLIIDDMHVDAGTTVVPPEGCLCITAYVQGGSEPVTHISPCAIQFDRPADIYTVRLSVNDYEPFGRSCVDYLGKDAIGEFIRRTHDQYAQRLQPYFGSTVQGIFMDETRLMNALPWTHDFPREFKKRKGYDILPHLHWLLRKGTQGHTVRYDYFDVVADLLAQATFQQIYDWCQSHGLASIGHVLGEETLAAQSRFNADIMRLFRYMHIPGIDHLGNGIGGINAKICSSAAHNYGKRTVASESFGACGWDMTYEELVKISNWLFQQGVNHIIIHGFYYSIRDWRRDDWPPSYFYQWKDWRYMKEYAAMAARMSAALQDTVNESHILVYYPLETFWAHYDPDFKTQTCYFKDGPAIADETAAKIDWDFQMLCSVLSNENLDFEILNADACDGFQAREGRLVNTLTQAWYGVIIVPCVELLPAETVLLFNQFAEQGGHIIGYRSESVRVVGKRGEHVHSPGRLPALDTRSWTMARTVEEAATLCAPLADTPYRLLSDNLRLVRTNMAYPPRLHDPYLHDGEQVFGVGITSHVNGDQRLINIVNYNLQEETATLSVRSAELPYVMVPQTGETSQEGLVEQGAGWYRICLTLPANRALLIICKIG